MSNLINSPKDAIKKRKSDHLKDNQSNENGKRMKTSDEVIELSDSSNDSIKLKIVNEVKSNKIEVTKLNEKESNQTNKLGELKLEEIKNSLRFYLNKVNGLTKTFNNEFTLTIKEILSKEFGNNLKRSCQFSYTYDIDWLINQYDKDYQGLPLTIVAQQKQPTIDSLKSICKNYSNIELCFARLQG